MGYGVFIKFRYQQGKVYLKMGNKVDLVVEEMDAKQAKLFALLDLGEFIGK